MIFFHGLITVFLFHESMTIHVNPPFLDSFPQIGRDYLWRVDRRQPFIGSSTTCRSADHFLISFGQKAQGDPWRTGTSGTSGTSATWTSMKVDELPFQHHQTSGNSQWEKAALGCLEPNFLSAAGRFESNHIAKYFETRNGMLGPDPWHRRWVAERLSRVSWKMVKIRCFQCVFLAEWWASQKISGNMEEKPWENIKRGEKRRIWCWWNVDLDKTNSIEWLNVLPFRLSYFR